jgi:hypothetical protein
MGMGSIYKNPSLPPQPKPSKCTLVFSCRVDIDIAGDFVYPTLQLQWNVTLIFDLQFQY